MDTRKVHVVRELNAMGRRIEEGQLRIGELQEIQAERREAYQLSSEGVGKQKKMKLKKKCTRKGRRTTHM